MHLFGSRQICFKYITTITAPGLWKNRNCLYGIKTKVLTSHNLDDDITCLVDINSSLQLTMLCIIAWNGQTDRAIRAASCLSTTCPLHSQTLGVTLIFRHTLASLFSPQVSKCTRTTGGYCRSHTLTSVQMQWLLTVTLQWTSSGTVRILLGGPSVAELWHPPLLWWWWSTIMVSNSILQSSTDGTGQTLKVMNSANYVSHVNVSCIFFFFQIRFIAMVAYHGKLYQGTCSQQDRNCEPVWKYPDTGLASNLAGQI